MIGINATTLAMCPLTLAARGVRVGRVPRIFGTKREPDLPIEPLDRATLLARVGAVVRPDAASAEPRDGDPATRVDGPRPPEQRIWRRALDRPR